MPSPVSNKVNAKRKNSGSIISENVTDTATDTATLTLTQPSQETIMTNQHHSDHSDQTQTHHYDPAPTPVYHGHIIGQDSELNPISVDLPVRFNAANTGLDATVAAILDNAFSAPYVAKITAQLKSYRERLANGGAKRGLLVDPLAGGNDALVAAYLAYTPTLEPQRRSSLEVAQEKAAYEVVKILTERRNASIRSGQISGSIQIVGSITAENVIQGMAKVRASTKIETIDLYQAQLALFATPRVKTADKTASVKLNSDDLDI